MHRLICMITGCIPLFVVLNSVVAAETSVPTIDGLRSIDPTVGSTAAATVDAYRFAGRGGGGGGRFQWEAQLTEPDDGGTVIKPAATAGAGRWVRVRKEQVVDAREYGCAADYEMIGCSITADGHLTRMREGKPVSFQTSDIGKIVIIDAARSWDDYSLDPVPLNGKISSVDGVGIATVQNIDEKERGSILANPSTTAELFTDNTDAIARALAYQAAHKLSHVQLPDDGVVGLCPFVSETWKQAPYLDNATHTKPVFLMKDGALLKGAGKSKTRLKIGYFGEFEPYKVTGAVPYRYWPVMFMFEPVEGKAPVCGIESFTLEFPFSPVVEAGYTLVADAWNSSPARHALQATIRDIAVVNPQRNTVLLYSINGGLYRPDNSLAAESKYLIENCDFETGGGCSFKNQNTLTHDQKGGKSVYLNNVVFRGGGNIITRHYTDVCTFEKTGNEYFLQVNQAGFSWKNFNAHSDQVKGAFNPTCMVRKAYKGKIRSLKAADNGQYQMSIEGDGPAPVTKADATVLINFGLGDKQIYLENVASMTAGSDVVVANLSWAELDAAQVQSLAGAPIRIYYDENRVKALYDIVNPRRIRLDPASASGQSLAGQNNLDVTVNYEGARGAFGHTFYVGQNVNFYIKGMKIYDCAKRSFRVSKGGSEAAAGDHELTDYEVIPARGMAAMCNLRTVQTANEEFGGPLKVRRSRVSSVYAVTLDMDDHSTYIAQGGINGGSIIRNSKVSGLLAGGAAVTRIEDSQVDLCLSRLDELGNRANVGVIENGTPRLSLQKCTGTLLMQNGIVEANDSTIQFGFLGDGAQYDQWKNAIKGSYNDCRVGEPIGLHVISAEQRADFLSRQTVIRPSK